MRSLGRAGVRKIANGCISTHNAKCTHRSLEKTGKKSEYEISKNDCPVGARNVH
jgi:hypothetical protein